MNRSASSNEIPRSASRMAGESIVQTKKIEVTKDISVTLDVPQISMPNLDKMVGDAPEDLVENKEYLKNNLKINNLYTPYKEINL